MSPGNTFDSQSRRLAVYGYLAPLLDGQKVLELGCGDGAGAARLRALGAASVLGLESDPAALARARNAGRQSGLQFAALDRRALDGVGPFDLIVVPDGAAWLGPGAPFGLAALRSLLTPEGKMALVAASTDRPDTPGSGGVSYYVLLEALEPLFPRVRMFGLTPFAAFGAAEFGAQTVGLRIESGLVDEANEHPTHYLAVAGPEDRLELGYALLQIPLPVAPVGRVEEVMALEEESRSAVVGLRQRLVEAEGKAEGMLRVSRAQAEEIEELRGRLRRGAEARSELDQEIARLRRALADADASVLDLTRRTREEVAELARQITSGLRTDGRAAAPAARDDGALARLREELRRRGEELAAREAAVSERDERIAALEAEKQDLTWRLQAALAKRAEKADGHVPARSRNGSARPEDLEASEELHQRTQALGAIDQYRMAATAHLQEVNRLREALAEQSTLVNELEDALAGASRRAQTAEGELTRVRQHTSEVEQADRVRRSRLAEVEGTLLRLKSQAAAAAPPPPPPAPVAAPIPAAPVPSAELEQARGEIAHLRDALDRTEEQLWETKGQMLLDQERLAGLEQQLAAARTRPPEPPAPPEAREPTVSEAAHHAILGAALGELAEIELGVRLEIGKLDSLERLIESWRSDLSIASSEDDVSITRAD
jgi:SAM-dependent methyltransferase